MQQFTQFTTACLMRFFEFQTNLTAKNNLRELILKDDHTIYREIEVWIPNTNVITCSICVHAEYESS